MLCNNFLKKSGSKMICTQNPGHISFSLLSRHSISLFSFSSSWKFTLLKARGEWWEGSLSIVKTYISLVKGNIPFKMFPSVMLWGPPGVGKSQGIREVAVEIEKQTGKNKSVFIEPNH